MNFFKSKTKTPPEIIRAIREAIARLDASTTGAEGRRKVRTLFSLRIGRIASREGRQGRGTLADQRRTTGERGYFKKSVSDEIVVVRRRR